MLMDLRNSNHSLNYKYVSIRFTILNLMDFFRFIRITDFQSEESAIAKLHPISFGFSYENWGKTV